MHELAIAQSVLNTISSWRDQNGAPDVLSATVEVGRLSGVDPESLQYAWSTACEFVCGGKLQNCRLKIEFPLLKYSCSSCGRTFESEKLMSECPHCGGESPVRSGGKELNLLNIEVENV